MDIWTQLWRVWKGKRGQRGSAPTSKNGDGDSDIRSRVWVGVLTGDFWCQPRVAAGPVIWLILRMQPGQWHRFLPQADKRGAHQIGPGGLFSWFYSFKHVRIVLLAKAHEWIHTVRVLLFMPSGVQAILVQCGSAPWSLTSVLPPTGSSTPCTVLLGLLKSWASFLNCLPTVPFSWCAQIQSFSEPVLSPRVRLAIFPLGCPHFYMEDFSMVLAFALEILIQVFSPCQ